MHCKINNQYVTLLFVFAIATKIVLLSKSFGTEGVLASTGTVQSRNWPIISEFLKKDKTSSQSSVAFISFGEGRRQGLVYYVSLQHCDA